MGSWSGRRLAYWAAVVVSMLVATQLMLLRPVSAASWTVQSSGTSAKLTSISCPTTLTCWASGGNEIIATTNGGWTWTTQRSGGIFAIDSVSCPSTTTCWATNIYDILATTDGGQTWGVQHSTGGPYYDVTCPTTSQCVAVGYRGALATTTNGGATWTARASGSANDLVDVTCVSSSACWASGWGGTIVATTNGGTTWAAQSSGTVFQVEGIGCASATTCWGATSNDNLRYTTNGGATWGPQAGAFNTLNISCVTDKCWAVGPGGSVVTNVSGSWAAEASGTSNTLWGITCPTAGTCWAVGDNGTIVVRNAPPRPNLAPTTTLLSPANGAAIPTGAPQTLTARGDDPDAESYTATFTVKSGSTVVRTGSTGSAASGTAVSFTLSPPLTSGTYTWSARATDARGLAGNESASRTFTVTPPPSQQCEGGVGVDGFSGDAYLKLQAAPSLDGVCVRINDGPATLVGGKIVVDTGGVQAPGTAFADDDAQACAAAANLVPGTHPLNTGSIGDPSEPQTYVEYAVDAYASTGSVQVCASVTTVNGTVTRRVVIPIDASVTTPDPRLVADPPGTPLPSTVPNAATPSNTCAAGSGAVRVLDAEAAEGHVWLYHWTESSSRMHLCVRSSTLGVGGRFTIDTAGTPGSLPTPTTGSNPAVCSLSVASQGAPVPISVRRSATGADPVSLCVSVNGTTVTLTATTNVSLPQPTIVTWQGDAGTP